MKTLKIKELHYKGSDLVFIKRRNRSDVEPLSYFLENVWSYIAK